MENFHLPPPCGSILPVVTISKRRGSFRNSHCYIGNSYKRKSLDNMEERKKTYSDGSHGFTCNLERYGRMIEFTGQLKIKNLISNGDYTLACLSVKLLDKVKLHGATRCPVFEYIFGDGETVCILRSFYDKTSLKIGTTYNILNGFNVTVDRHVIWYSKSTKIMENLTPSSELVNYCMTEADYMKLYPGYKNDYELLQMDEWTLIWYIGRVCKVDTKNEMWSSKSPKVKLWLSQGGSSHTKNFYMTLSMWRDFNLTIEVGDLLMVRNVPLRFYDNKPYVNVNHLFDFEVIKEEDLVKLHCPINITTNKSLYDELNNKAVGARLINIFKIEEHSLPQYQTNRCRSGDMQVFIQLLNTGLDVNPVKLLLAHCSLLPHLIEKRDIPDQDSTPDDIIATLNNLTSDSCGVVDIKIKCIISGDRLVYVWLDEPNATEESTKEES